MSRLCGNSSRLICMMVLVTVYMFVELFVGYFIHSLALVADAFHMLSDLIALIVGLVATRISKWPRSSRNTFGWQRAEVVGGLINTVILVTLCSTILLDAIQRFVRPDRIDDPQMMVSVGAGGLLVNVLGLLVLGVHSHSSPETITEVGDVESTEPMTGVNTNELPQNELNHTRPDDSNQFNGPNSRTHCKDHKRHGHKAGKGSKKSMNMRAVFLHVLADFFGSVIVVVSALILWLVPEAENRPSTWKMYVDPTMSCVMVIIILSSTIPLLRKTALILLQSVPSEICLVDLNHRLENIDGIHKIHDLHVWRLQSNCIIGTVHLRCVSLPDYLVIARKVKELFHEFNIHCTTIQPEFVEVSPEQQPSQINYETCVLDCGPNTNCQSDTCCPSDSVSGPVICTGQPSSSSVPLATHSEITTGKQSSNCQSFDGGLSVQIFGMDNTNVNSYPSDSLRLSNG